jgi:hypothetical protein
MVNLRPTRKAKTSPVEGRGLGDVKTEEPIGTVTSKTGTEWTFSLNDAYLKTYYGKWLESAVSSAVSTTFTSTTTSAGSSYIPGSVYTRPSYGSISTAASIGKLYTTLGELDRRISRDDMRAIVDRLVKERYPAYEPLDR